MAIIQQEDSIDDFSNWNQLNSDATAVQEIATTGGAFGSFNAIRWSKFTTSGFNRVGVHNKTIPGSTVDRVFRHVVRFNAFDMKDSTTIMTASWGIMKDPGLSILGAFFVGWRSILNGGGAGQIVPSLFRQQTADDGVFGTPIEYSANAYYETRLVINVNGGVEWWIKGGVEHPVWTDVGTQLNQLIWNPNAGARLMANVSIVKFDVTDINFELSHVAVADAFLDLPDFVDPQFGGSDETIVDSDTMLTTIDADWTEVNTQSNDTPDNAGNNGRRFRNTNAITETEYGLGRDTSETHTHVPITKPGTIFRGKIVIGSNTSVHQFKAGINNSQGIGSSFTGSELIQGDFVNATTVNMEFLRDNITAALNARAINVNLGDEILWEIHIDKAFQSVSYAYISGGSLFNRFYLGFFNFDHKSIAYFTNLHSENAFSVGDGSVRFKNHEIVSTIPAADLSPPAVVSEDIGIPVGARWVKAGERGLSGLRNAPVIGGPRPRGFKPRGGIG